MTEANAGFGIPEANETPEQRVARLRAKAVAQVEGESDAQILARFVAEERQKRIPQCEIKDTQGFPADYDKIEVYKGREKHDLAYVPLSVNGFCIKVPRGEVVILPHIFVEESLGHAIEGITIQDKGGLIIRNSHRFPYRFIGKATPDEYHAFQAGQQAKAAREIGVVAT